METKPSVEIALRSAGADGLTIKELCEKTDLGETTVRRKVAEHNEAGQVIKKPSFDGVKVVWGTKARQPAEQEAKPLNPRRAEALRRDELVASTMQNNPPLTIAELARIIDAPDIDTTNHGWSQLTYLAVRRLQRKGLCDRKIAWVWIDEKDPPDEEAVAES